MTTRSIRWLAPLGIALLALAAFGGWAVVTVADMPDAAVLHHPIALTYTVRQHGHTLLDDLHGSIEASNGDQVVRAEATKGHDQGQYTATFVPTRSGDWTVTIRTGFMSNEVTLPTIPVVDQGVTPAALSDAERGRRLFVAKGCVTCHVHGDVAGSGRVAVGPELTALRFDPDYLRRFLSNPSIKPPLPGTNMQMPNLGLKPPEIAALTAFINGELRASR